MYYRKKLVLSLFIILFSLPALSIETIKIGAPLPLTGKLSVEAIKQQRGYELWADLVNAQGGIEVAGSKHLVKIIYADYQSKPGKVREIVDSLLSKNNVDLLFAPYGSKATREASPIAQKYKTPMIAVTASSKQAYSRGHDYIFGIFTPNETLIEPLMHIVQQRLPKVNNIALLVRQDLFPLSIAREVLNASKNHNIDVVYYEKYDINHTDYTSLLRQLKSAQPTWIIALGYTEDLVQVRKQMSTMGITAPFLTMIAAPAYKEFIDATGGLSENVTSTAWWHPAVKYKGSGIFETTENFVQLFKQRYNKQPDYVEASAALAGSLFQLAIERAGSLNGTKVRNELAKMNESTFWGPVRFGQNGQNNTSAPLVFQIQQRETVIIYPTAIATGQLQLNN